MNSRIRLSWALMFLAAVACGDDAATGSAEYLPAELEVVSPSAPAPPPAARRGAIGAPVEAAGAADRALRAETLPADVDRSPTDLQTPGQEPEAPAMLIRTGRAEIEVDSLETAVAGVTGLAQRLGGYVANSDIQAGDERLRRATLELKIPAERFDEAVGGLASIGKVESVQVQAQDVTEEFVDVTARTENARRLEERLIDLLARRTGDLQQVLMVERELARVREQIERYEGQLRYLRSRAAVSTLTVEVHEPPPLVGGEPGTNVIVEAFRESWRNFVGLAAAVIASLGVVVPVVVVAFAGWLLIRRLYGRRRRIRRAE